MAANLDRQNGYWFKFDNGGDAKHEFCGEHSVDGASCPNCDKPLLRLVSLDMSAKEVSRIESFGDRLNLFFCWTCPISQEEFIYEVLEDGGVKILKYGKGESYIDFPYDQYPVFFPLRAFDLEKLTSNEQEVIIQLNNNSVGIYDLNEDLRYLSMPAHQLGGEPYIIQSDLANIRCPRCKNEMNFLVSVADKHSSEISFTENEYVQLLFHICNNCSIVSAKQYCD